MSSDVGTLIFSFIICFVEVVISIHLLFNGFPSNIACNTYFCQCCITCLRCMYKSVLLLRLFVHHVSSSSCCTVTETSVLYFCWIFFCFLDLFFLLLWVVDREERWLPSSIDRGVDDSEPIFVVVICSEPE